MLHWWTCVDMQTNDVTYSGASDLLSSAYQLTNKDQITFIGGERTGANAVAGWAWVDGTPATNLNCGS